MDDLQSMIERIKKVFPEEVQDIYLHTTGEDFFGIEINHAWIFRFARHAYARQALQRERRFLPPFLAVSPLPVPDIRYADDDFIGYPKIPGSEFTPQLFGTLTQAARKRTALQFGEFLSAIHAFPAQAGLGIGLLEEWGGWRLKMAELYRKAVLPQLTPAARSRSLEVLEQYFTLAYTPVIIHGDFYLSEHVFFDPQRQELCGVIDFADTTLGDAAADFICFWDDCSKDFYEDVLDHYQGIIDDSFLERVKIRTLARPVFDASYYLDGGVKDKYDECLEKIETLYG
ncbi:MAG TPA: phosphotransferase [Longilinea sp.]|nr:phosphotransferase [Longilinea sp.]